MIKILYKFIFGICSLSWLLIIVLLSIYVSPSYLLKTLNNLVFSSYAIEFSEVINEGAINNPILTFTNIDVLKDNKEVFSADRFSLGVVIDLGILSNKPKINFASFENLILVSNGGNIQIDGELYNSSHGVLNGHFNLIHDGHVSVLSVNSDGNTTNFLVNLHENKWLNLIPNNLSIPFKVLRFGIQAVGQINKDFSIIKGSLSHSEIKLNDMVFRPNRGSFLFESQGELAAISLNKFLYAFVDEQIPIKINLSDRSVIIPKLYISKDMFLNDTNLNEIKIYNFYLRSQIKNLTYSGFIADLDLSNVYFNEIQNIKGGFSGKNTDLNFDIFSNNSFIRDSYGSYYPISIDGRGEVSNNGFLLKAKIKPKIGNIDLDLKIDNTLDHPLSLKFLGTDLSQEIILASLPKGLTNVYEFIDSSFDNNNQGLIFLEYLSSGPKKDSEIFLKFDLEDVDLRLNSNLNLKLNSTLLELNKENLYIFAPSGIINNNVLAKNIFGNINFSTQSLSYASSHSINNDEFSNIFNSSSSVLADFSFEGLNKGKYYFLSKNFMNSTSLKSKKFSYDLRDNFDLNVSKGQIFLVNLESIYGKFPAKFSSQDIEIILSGGNLQNNFYLNLQSLVQLELTKFIPRSSLFEVSGNSLFAVNYLITKNQPFKLKLSSDLKGSSFDSDLSILQKPKSNLLPTIIELTNFDDPILFVSNKLFKLNLTNFDELNGYISVGGELPTKYDHLKALEGINVYFESNTLNFSELENFILNGSPEGRLNLNKLIFKIKNFYVSKNQFSNLLGNINFKPLEVNGNIHGDNLNVFFKADKSGFIELEFHDSNITDTSFLTYAEDMASSSKLDSRLIIKNSSINEIKVKFLDIYLLKNKDLFTINTVNVDSNLVSIKPKLNDTHAYFSIDNSKSLYKIRGDFLIKDSRKVPFIGGRANFSYFHGDINLQWKNFQSLRDIEGEVDFILKDFSIKDGSVNSVAFNLLGIFNLKNVLGKLINFDLSIDEYTSTTLNRVEGEILFNKSKARLLSPLFVDTNVAKMKWAGQINKNYKGELQNLDLNLDLRLRVGENIPWYAAILGGLPAVAGSAVIAEIFEENLNDLSNYQYEVVGTLNKPIINRTN